MSADISVSIGLVAEEDAGYFYNINALKYIPKFNALVPYLNVSRVGKVVNHK